MRFRSYAGAVDRPSTTIRQLGALAIALGMAIGALGLPGWPYLAWSLSLGLNLIAAIASAPSWRMVVEGRSTAPAYDRNRKSPTSA